MGNKGLWAQIHERLGFATHPQSSEEYEEYLTPTDDEISRATARYMSRYDKLVREFNEKTGLTDLDMTIRDLCAELQTLLRRYFFSNETMKFENDQQADRAINRIAPKYLPESVHDVIDGSVPYDAIRRSKNFKVG